MRERESNFKNSIENEPFFVLLGDEEVEERVRLFLVEGFVPSK